MARAYLNKQTIRKQLIWTKPNYLKVLHELTAMILAFLHGIRLSPKFLVLLSDTKSTFVTSVCKLSLSDLQPASETGAV